MHNGRYDKIIDMPHHVSQSRKRMSRKDRAAQFASFQALTGLSDDIKEAERITESKTELCEEEEFLINTTLQKLISSAKEKPKIKITYFVQDTKKSGGAYKTLQGRFRTVFECDGLIVLDSGEKIPIADILNITII